MIARILDGLLPHHCHLCQTPCRTLLCADCQPLLKVNHTSCIQCDLPMNQPGLCPECLQQPTHFDRVLCGLEFDIHSSFLINQMKHQRATGWIDFLVKPLSAKIESEYGGHQDLPEILIPVPLHWRRFLMRGFNQSTLLAHRLGRSHRIPVVPAIKKKHATVLQQGLNRKQRRKNLEKVFAIQGDLRAKHVAIVDDVVTTCATVDILAKLLKSYGIERVDVWALARTPK